MPNNIYHIVSVLCVAYWVEKSHPHLSFSGSKNNFSVPFQFFLDFYTSICSNLELEVPYNSFFICVTWPQRGTHLCVFSGCYRVLQNSWKSLAKYMVSRDCFHILQEARASKPWSYKFIILISLLHLSFLPMLIHQ